MSEGEKNEARSVIYARPPISLIENVYRAGRHHDEDI